MKNLFVMLSCVLLLSACGGGGGGTNQTNPGSTTLPAPTGVVATSSASKNTITWQPVVGATSYNIYWSTSPNVNKSNGSKIINASSPFVHTGLVDTQKYYYVITSMKDNFESDISSELEMRASKVIAMDAFDYSLIALKSDGSVWISGNYINSDFSTPKQVFGLTSVTKVSVGGVSNSPVGNNYLALKSDGTLWAWGDNTWGQSGNGTTISSVTPVQVNIADVVEIHSARMTNFAIKRDGTVWAWGYNDGSLGYVGVTNDFKSSPVQIPNLSGIVGISSYGNSAYFAVKNDGTAWVWGNGYSVLGTKTNAVPVMLPVINNVKKIMAPYFIAVDGSVWSWGGGVFNSSGLPRLVTEADVSTPTKLIGIDNILSMSLKLFTFVKSDGTVWSAGYDASQNISLLKINPLDDAISTASTVLATFVLRRDGSIVKWNWSSAAPSAFAPVVVNGI